MAVILDLIDLAVFPRRVVHHHHVVGVEVVPYELLVEALRSVGLGAHELVLGVVAGPLELCRRLSETDHEHPVDFLQHAGLQGLEVLPFRFPEPEPVFTQLVGKLGAHLGSVVRTVGLGHHLGRDHSVLHHQVGHAGELASVTDRVAEKPVYLTVFEPFVAGVYHSLEEKVGLLQLVVEEQIVLRESETAKVVLFYHLCPEDVQSGEKPAAAG